MPESGFQGASGGPRFRSEKKHLLSLLARPDWRPCFCEGLARAEGDRACAAKHRVNPLLAMLPRAELRYQAAICLGEAMALCAVEDREFTRNIMRRLMWSLNEESGNLGWGCPEAFGAAVAASPAIQQEFERVLVSYIIDTGKADNYIDHAPLRLGAYWAVGHAAGGRNTAWFQILPWLVKGLDPQQENDIPCSTMCLWALARTVERGRALGERPGVQEAPLWNRMAAAIEGAALSGREATVTVYEQGEIVDISRSALCERALGAVRFQ